MFEQMRANVGKLLKGIDRSELGCRARSGQAGWRRRGASRGGGLGSTLGQVSPPSLLLSPPPQALGASQALSSLLFLPAIKRKGPWCLPGRWEPEVMGTATGPAFPDLGPRSNRATTPLNRK